MIEAWKDICGYEGLYKVSDYGRVKRIVFINGQCRIDREKILKQILHSDGRYFVALCKNNTVKIMPVSRLVATAFHENPNNLPVVNHIDFNPKKQ